MNLSMFSCSHFFQIESKTCSVEKKARSIFRRKLFTNGEAQVQKFGDGKANNQVHWCRAISRVTSRRDERVTPKIWEMFRLNQAMFARVFGNKRVTRVHTQPNTHKSGKRNRLTKKVPGNRRCNDERAKAHTQQATANSSKVQAQTNLKDILVS